MYQQIGILEPPKTTTFADIKLDRMTNHWELHFKGFVKEDTVYIKEQE